MSYDPTEDYIQNYLVIKLGPKEKEMKILARTFGCRLAMTYMVQSNRFYGTDLYYKKTQICYVSSVYVEAICHNQIKIIQRFVRRNQGLNQHTWMSVCDTDEESSSSTGLIIPSYLQIRT